MLIRGGYWNRFGQRFDRYKKTPHVRRQKEGEHLSGQAEHGHGNTQKNHYVGCGPGGRLFQRAFPHLTEPDYLGGNYFQLPPTRCFLVWRKLSISESFSMAMCEYAWTSFSSNAKVFEHTPQGDRKDKRFHPTQKPVALYKWILANYAKQGDTILDTHVGSASSLIACEEMGFKYVGFEIDEDYYRMAKERLNTFNAQVRMEL